MRRAVAFGLWSVGMVGVGGYFERHRRNEEEYAGSWRTCCSASEPLHNSLQEIVGVDHVLTGSRAASFSKGNRIGQGKALAVVRPGSFQEARRVVEACMAAGVAVLPQGANTGLTGGSVPRDSSGRDVVIVNMRRLNRMIPLNDGQQILAYAGAGIHDLSELCHTLGRESHSVLGSIFLNPSVGGGVALGSGGTQLRKGSVYTDRVLYLRVNEEGKVELHNSLGLLLPDLNNSDANNEPQTDADVLGALDSGAAVVVDPQCTLESHDESYRQRVCECDTAVSRYNADIRGNEAVRSEGKVLILASVHSTFPEPSRSLTLWIGCRDFELAHDIRRLCLDEPNDLPSALEYIDRDAFDVIDRAGRFITAVLRLLGISPPLQTLFDIKKRVESLPIPGFDRIGDKFFYYVNPLLPNSLSSQIYKCGQHYDHNLLITIDDYGNGGYDRLLAKLDSFARTHAGNGDVQLIKCTETEGRDATYFRFVMGSAYRAYCAGRGLKGLSVDYALPKNYRGIPSLKDAGVSVPDKRMRVSHFGCAVFHEEIMFQQTALPIEAEKLLVKKAIEEIGGALPAEHGHGTEYHAPSDTEARWKHTDPTNAFNPGVGQTTPNPRWE